MACLNHYIKASLNRIPPTKLRLRNISRRIRIRISSTKRDSVDEIFVSSTKFSFRRRNFVAEITFRERNSSPAAETNFVHRNFVLRSLGIPGSCFVDETAWGTKFRIRNRRLGEKWDEISSKTVSATDEFSPRRARKSMDFVYETCSGNKISSKPLVK